jgi:hypothetical protein
MIKVLIFEMTDCDPLILFVQYSNENQILLAPVGVLFRWSVHARPSDLPPIDTSRLRLMIFFSPPIQIWLLCLLGCKDFEYIVQQEIKLYSIFKNIEGSSIVKKLRLSSIFKEIEVVFRFQKIEVVFHFSSSWVDSIMHTTKSTS